MDAHPISIMSCKECNSKILRSDDNIQCASSCKRLFHRKCITELTGDADPKIWTCDLCKKEDNLMTYMKKNFKDLKDLTKGIEESQKFMSDQYDDIRKQLSEITLLTGKVKKLEEENLKKDLVISELNVRVNALEQYSRKNNFEIRGVSKTKDENVEEVVLKIAQKLDVVMTLNDIQNAHRLQAAPGKIPSIIVKVVNYKKKMEMLNKKQKTITNSIIFSNPQEQGKIYIDDHLSAFNKDLLWKTKLRAKEHGYKFVWWKNKILVRKNEQSKAFQISSEKDIKKINSTVNENEGGQNNNKNNETLHQHVESGNLLL